MANRLAGKIALVTGASRRIGKAIALRLAQEGAAVVCAASRLENALPTVETIMAAGGKAAGLGVQMEDSRAASAMIAAAEEQLGPVDILVNCAGTAVLGSVLELGEQDWDTVMNVNLKSVFLSCQQAARRMRDRGRGGVIVNIGSIAGINGFPERVAYGTSKAALHHMTRIMALDLAPFEIRVNCIAPGYIDHTEDTEFVRRGLLDLDALRERIPQHRIGEGKDIAAAVAYLASDDGRYVTGTILTVDGGFTAYGYV